MAPSYRWSTSHLVRTLWISPWEQLRGDFSDRRVILLILAVVLACPALSDLVVAWQDRLPVVLAASFLYSLPVFMVSVVLAPSMTIATLSLANVAGRWLWREWARRLALLAVYGFLFIWVFIIGAIGVVLPFMQPYAPQHDFGTRLIWVLVGVPTGLVVWAVGGLAWAGAVSEHGYRDAVRRVMAAPLEWVLATAQVSGLVVLMGKGLDAIPVQQLALGPWLTSYLYYLPSVIVLVVYGAAWAALASA